LFPLEGDEGGALHLPQYPKKLKEWTMEKDFGLVRVGFDQQLKKGRFCSRPNRFLAYVEIDGKKEAAHVADSGRLKELLVPGATVYLMPKEGANRKTKWQLVLVEKEGILVSIYSQLPNKLVYEALRAQKLPEFAAYPYVKSEYKVGGSRFDFALAKEKVEPFAADCLIEVKSVTLVEGGTGLFPDAPTSRGVKHIKELIELKEEGREAAILFIVQRHDAVKVRPNASTDPEFAETLSFAKRSGVGVFAYTSALDLGGITLKCSIPVEV